MTAQSIITHAPLVYHGAIIRDRADMLSLTDMWKAAGADQSKRPVEWLRSKSARAFIDVLSEMVGKSHLFEIGKGRTSETRAHWQIGLAYAKYLSPEFHMWCNTVVRQHMEGVKLDGLPAVSLEQIERTYGMIRMVAHKVTELEHALPGIVASMVEPLVAAKFAERHYLIRRGKTAGQIWREAGFPRMRVTSWFSNRLCEMGCQIDGGGRGELGLGTAKLFDPDRAQNWLRNGGRQLIETYIAERQGQGRLRLVSSRP